MATTITHGTNFSIITQVYDGHASVQVRVLAADMDRLRVFLDGGERADRSVSVPVEGWYDRQDWPDCGETDVYGHAVDCEWCIEVTSDAAAGAACRVQARVVSVDLWVRGFDERGPQGVSLMAWLAEEVPAKAGYRRVTDVLGAPDALSGAEWLALLDA